MTEHLKTRIFTLSFLLTPATLHILLALAAEDLHGYGIMQGVARQPEGRYKLGPGTVYDNLQRMMKQRMVGELGGPAEVAWSTWRYYSTRFLGRELLWAEVVCLQGL